MSKLLPRRTSSAAIVVVASLLASSPLSGQSTTEGSSLAGSLAARSVNQGVSPPPSAGLTLNQRLMWDVLSLFEDSVAAEGAWERGIDYVGRILEDEPNDAWTHRTLAINFLDHGDYGLAHRHFQSYPAEYDLGDWSGYRWQASMLANLSDRWMLVSRTDEEVRVREAEPPVASRAWFMTFYRQDQDFGGEKYDQTRLLMEFDCQDQKLRWLTSDYLKNGRRVGSPGGAVDWQYVFPETVGESMWEGVCSPS